MHTARLLILTRRLIDGVGLHFALDNIHREARGPVHHAAQPARGQHHCR